MYLFSILVSYFKFFLRWFILEKKGEKNKLWLLQLQTSFHSNTSWTLKYKLRLKCTAYFWNHREWFIEMEAKIVLGLKIDPYAQSSWNGCSKIPPKMSKLSIVCIVHTFYQIFSTANCMILMIRFHNSCDFTDCFWCSNSLIIHVIKA